MKYLPVFLLAAFLASGCSSINDDAVTEPPLQYFPLEANSYWTYRNSVEPNIGAPKDSLYLIGPQELNNETYFNLDAKSPVTGFMTSAFSNNLTRTNESQLIVNGSLSVGVFEGTPALNISLNDAVFYDTNAIPGAQLSNVMDKLTQELNGIPLVSTVETITVQRGILDTYSVDSNATYTNVINSDLIVNLEVIALGTIAGIEVPVTVMNAQNILVVSNYYAEDIGLVYSELRFKYELEDFSELGVELPFENSVDIANTQSLLNYVGGN